LRDLFSKDNIILDFFSVKPDKPIMESLIFTTEEALDEIRRMADGAGVTIPDALRRAGVSRVTWWTWVRGRKSPRMRTLAALVSAIEDLAQNRP
jgi:predicted transcriptional regulator